MSSRRWFYAAVALSAALHLIGMARTPLPAQDGLKFLRVARQFQTQAWGDVVRSSDQHPLYSAFIAAAEPVVSLVVRSRPDAWRIAAQGVSALAAVALLWPLRRMTANLFDEPTANLTVLLYALLPFPAAIGHDTLSDSLALSFTVAALCLGEATLRTGRWAPAIGCGIAAGLGFLTRPEAALVPPVVALASVWRRRSWAGELAMFGRLAAMAATLLVFVGGYALVKGELSEKLSLRWSTRIGTDAYVARKPPPVLPRGLDDPRFDFSPKEESGQASLAGRPLDATIELAREWGEGVTWVLVIPLVGGFLGARKLGASVDARRLLVIYLGVFSLIAIRHAATLGYLSGRHALSLVVATIPFASAGLIGWASGFPARRGMSLAMGRRLGYVGLAALAVVGVVAQAKAGHPSRWGYHAAGIWLAEKAGPGDAVLDTRGWASFVRGIPGYDYWHVKQALADRKLKYVVVGSDELKAPSRRAATLRAMLARAGTPVASFSGRRDGRGSGVEVYRFEAPESWEGITP
jgi:hypothetical protein